FVKDARLIADAVASFPGLAHRIEEVGRVGKVRFVNDSKATNAEAAEKALVCFPDIFWIAGGRAKSGGIESLKPQFNRVHKAYLIGEASGDFSKTLDSTPHEICGTLEKAVATAFVDARTANVPAPVVLLSPACASFDQFADYEQRGDIFRALVGGLALPERQAS
ncbi:MAG TPA: cyanophycin synthetase, partial [Rhizomicrobium sp.]